VDEAQKAVGRRVHDSRFATRYFVGEGIDIGAGRDCLEHYKEFFPLIKSVKGWDWADGDAQYMESVWDNTYDFVHSSHCLEHMQEPTEAILNWLRILKPGGHLIVTVPDEDMYEQGVWPSTFNSDHKWTFTMYKFKSWSPKSINLANFLCLPKTKLVKLESLDQTFRHTEMRFDQTSTLLGECAIEFVLKKLI
jgi:ubiquinone/menaquinone biosynthesis C-methylase UbiE